MKALVNLRFMLAFAAACIAAYALYASLHWPFRTALFPRVIGIPLLLLALSEMALSIWGVEKEREGHAVDFELTTAIEPTLARKRTLLIFAWIFGFLVLILAFGFPLAVPIFVFAYLKIAGKESWTLSTVLTLVSWIFMEGVFDRFLHIPFPGGWILGLWR